MMKSKTCIYLLGLILLLGSCVPQRNLEYLSSDRKGEKSYEIPPFVEKKIQPEDQLSIQVSSFDDASFNYFETQSSGGAGGAVASELALSANAYKVDSEGMIDFPILGKFHIGGLTIDEATDKMEKELESYFNQPIVKLRYAYKKFTVLGEVGSPSTHLYAGDPFSIFEALAMAGDIAKTGNRKNVYLIRESGNQIQKYHLDLRNEELMFTEYYYIQANDVIYVKPNRNYIDWSDISAPLALISTTISTFLLIMTVSENYQFK